MARTRAHPGHPVDDNALAPYVSRLGVEWLTDHRDVPIRVVDGTLAFFDVSGFTRLSERLTRLGKVGGEEITAIVDRIFAELLGIALARGGDLLQFSGDAILVFFRGDGHAVRACVAAAQMQRSLEVVGRVDTELGRTRLRMSAGMHSGAFTFVLVGDEQRHVLALGAHATQTFRLEKEANGGEVLVGATTSRACEDARWFAAGRAGGHLLRIGWVARTEIARSRPADEAFELDRSMPVDISRLVAVNFRSLLRDGASSGEHRQLTAAFIGVRDLDARMGTDAIGCAEQLNALARAVEAAQRELAVTWVGVDALPGACDFFLVAGAPAMHEDDEDRLLLACRRLVEVKAGLETAGGVNRGRAFVVDIGHPLRRALSITGDVVNLAARVMARASRGELLATPTVTGRSRVPFALHEVEPFAAKGKSAPVVTFRVGPPAARAIGGTGPGVGSVPLVGRDEELGALRAALDAARSGAGQIVEVVADPGLGKTRLVEELRTSSTDVEWLSMFADPYGAQTAYGPWRELLRDMAGLGDHGNDAEHFERWARSIAPSETAWLPLIADAAGVELPPTPEVERLDSTFVRARRHDAIDAVLASARPRPTVLLVEDAHWLDDASRELLEHVGRACATRPWLVLVTRRPTTGALEIDAGHHEVVTLRPLPDDTTVRLALIVAGDHAFTDEAITNLAARAAGNALYVRELVAGAAAGLDELPESVERVIASRIDLLAAPARLLLRHAAVLGTSVDLDVLAAVLDDATVAGTSRWRVLDEYVERDGSVVRFRHDLFRLASYEGLAYRRRRELHSRIGELLEARGDADLTVVALHFCEGQQHGKAWEWSRRAAEDARDKSALVEALDLFRRALRAARHCDADANDVARVAEDLGDIATRLGRYDEARAAYALSRRHAKDDILAQARTTRKQGDVEELAGRYVASLRCYTRARSHLERMSEGNEATASELARVQLAYGKTRYFQGRVREATELTLQMLDTATELDDRRLLAQAHLQLEIMLTDLGAPSAVEHGEAALELLQDLGDDLALGNLLLNLGWSAYLRSDWAAALERYAGSRAAYQRAGDVVGAAMAQNNEAELLTDQGRYDEARAHVESARRALRAAGYRVGVVMTTSGLSRLELRAGRIDQAWDMLTQALEEFGELGASTYVLDTMVRQVEWLVEVGRNDEAIELAEQCERELARAVIPVLGTTVARLHGIALWQRGDVAEARSTLRQALEVARREHAEYEVARCLEALHVTGDRDIESAESQAIFERLGVVRAAWGRA